MIRPILFPGPAVLANVVIILTPLSRQRVTCHMSSIVGAGNDPARGHAMVRGSTVTRPTLVTSLGASGGPRTLIRTETLGWPDSALGSLHLFQFNVTQGRVLWRV